MDIRQLRYLVSLARERHFARAAEACGVAQPTLSAGLRHLEEDLGVMVVERGNRFKGLTPEGERVLSWAQRILADCEALEQELVGTRKSLRGWITIGVIPSALAMVGRLTSALMAAQPGLGVRLLSRSSIEIQRGLDDFELHAGITYLDNEPLSHVRSQPLYQERYVLLTTRDPGEPAPASISWAAAAQMQLCLLVTEMQNRRIVDAAFATAGAKPSPVVETDSIAALVNHVREGGLAAVAPDHLVTRLGLDSAVQAIPLEAPVLVHTVGLVVADRVPTPPFVAALWAAAQALGHDRAP
ncbi:MAG: LysR family transcriptional regulator [Geminicoccaceae bacterium]